MAVGIHIARTAFLPISRVTGSVVDKNAAGTTIKDVMQTENRHVVLPDTSNPNTANHPTVDQYLILEAASDYVLYHLDQNMIVTYDAGAVNGAS